MCYAGFEEDDASRVYYLSCQTADEVASWMDAIKKARSDGGLSQLVSQMTYKQTDEWMDGWMDRQLDKQTDRQDFKVQR